MARGCARIDYRPDKAKIGSADRVEVHHARLLAVIGVRKTLPHGLGQNRKSSLRAHVFRFTPESRHDATHSVCPFRAMSGSRTWLPRAAPHTAGPIHFSAQLFQHIRGLSPTSQFSPSGGAGGNAPTRGAEMPTRPSKALALAPLARCREVSWLVRAIAGGAGEAAAVTAADRKLSLAT